MARRRFESYYRIIKAKGTYEQNESISNTQKEARAKLLNPNLTNESRRQLSREAGYVYSV